MGLTAVGQADVISHALTLAVRDDAQLTPPRKYESLMRAVDGCAQSLAGLVCTIRNAEGSPKWQHSALPLS